MPRIKHRNDRSEMKRIARRAKMYLAAVILLLLAFVLVLAFQVKQDIWPGWLVEYRTEVIGIILLVVVAILALSPVIIEVSSNPRHLSGPGKNPEMGP